MIRFRCCTLLIAILLTFPALARSCERAYRLGWDPWPPYQYVNEQGVLTGLDIELMQAVFDAMGCEIRFQQLPWKRQLLHLQRGELDVVSSASRTAEREAFGRYSIPLRTERVVLLTQRNTLWQGKVRSLSDLQHLPMRLVGTIGYFYGDDFEALRPELLAQNRLMLVSSDQLAYQMLLNARADAMLADPVSAAAALQLMGETGSVQVLAPVHEAPTYALFSRKSVSRDFVEQFNLTVEQLQRRGILQEIVARYTLRAPAESPAGAQ
ncbi:transporter substrate-binding domain-containing protein [Hahella sp. SMD15-11]|uniref:Transporter substrate-binding domain-containing protein n=1 Tax=Thermohahella caldifontis TaxID=3142973 RepID=A0AB39UWJ8_9GAMM